MFGGTQSASGKSVDEDVAMTLSAVWACVRIIAGTIASEPLGVYKMDGSGDRSLARDHRLYKILHTQSNQWQTAFSYRETMAAHLLLWGNSFSWRQYDGAGNLIGLIPLMPSRVEVLRDNLDSPVRYKYTAGATPRILDAHEVLFIPALAYDGITGKSPIRAQAESIGTALAMQEFTAKFFANGAQESGVFRHPGELSDEAFNRLKTSIENRYAGSDNAWKPMLLEEGLDWTKTLIPPEDAQLLESRRFQGVEEIARIYGVPLHLIHETSKSTSWGSGIEQLNIGFGVHTIRHWNIRIEQAIQMQLLSEQEQKSYFVEHDMDGLLQGDIKTQSEYFSTAITKGWMTRNEVRRKKNLNALPELDAPLQELNLGEAGAKPADEMRDDCGCGQEHRELTSAQPKELRASQGKTRQTIQREHRPSIADSMARVIRRERADIMREANKQLKSRSIDSLEKFIDDFYTKHEEYTRSQVSAVFRALAGAIGAIAAPEAGADWQWTEDLEEWLTGYVERFANQHSNYGRQQLLQLLEDVEPDDDPLDILQTRLDEWVDGRDDAIPRADKIAGAESNNLGQAFTKAVFVGAGVTLLRWNAIGDSCPYCLGLDGTVVGIEQNFVNADSNFQPNGAASPMKPSSNVTHPPLHPGCECVIETE